MKITVISSLIIFLSFHVYSQDEIVIALKAVKGQIVEFETDEAKIYFAKTDFLKSFADFRKSAFHDLDEDEQRALNEAIKAFEKNKNTVSLKLVKDVKKENQDPLVYFIKIYAGAVLLNEQKAEVHNKIDNNKQNEILRRQVIDSPQGSAYLYSFKNGGKFFFGEVYGEHTIELEGDD